MHNLYQIKVHVIQILRGTLFSIRYINIDVTHVTLLRIQHTFLIVNS